MKMFKKKPDTQPKPYHYEYPRPSVTVDCVVFGADLEREHLEVLLIQRDVPPFEGAWALPGGFVLMDETLDEAAARELAEEAGVRDVFLEQLYTFGAPDRDPRGRVISVAYYALVKPGDYQARASTDARDAAWYSIDQLPDLPFDHAQIFETALERLRAKVRYRPIGFELLPPHFTLSQLQRLYEIILTQPIDKRNFIRKIRRLDIIEETGEKEQDVPHRAAMYYRFNQARYAQLERDGQEFSI